jgi:hypothetical protein
VKKLEEEKNDGNEEINLNLIVVTVANLEKRIKKMCE